MMNTRRGIVFETTSSYSIFFRGDGVFEKGIPLSASVEIGEEAFYTPLLKKRSHKATFNSTWTAPVLSMVATLVLLFSVLLPAQSPVSAYVQIDINPSVELGLDQEGKVYSFEGLNDDGEAMKRDIAFWKGKPLEWVLFQIVDRTDSTIENQDEIEITTIYENKEDHEKLEKVIVSAVSNYNSKSMLQKYSVNVSEASLEDRQAANKEGISVQKYKEQLKNNKVEKQEKIKKKEEKQQKIKKKDEKKPGHKKFEENKNQHKENKKESQIPAVDLKNPQYQKQVPKNEKPNKNWNQPVKSEVKTQSHQNQTKQQNESKREGKENKPSNIKSNHTSEKKSKSEQQDANHRQEKKGKNEDHDRTESDQKRKQKNQSSKEQYQQGENNNHTHQ